MIRDDEAQLDFRQRSTDRRARVVAATQQAIDDRKEERQVDVENQLAFERGRVDQIEAGRILEAEYEFAVRELIDAGELQLDDGAKQCRKRGAEIAAKCLVHRLQRAHLLLADALGPLEIVGRDFFAVPNAARGRVGNDIRLAAIHCAQQAFDFGLAKNVATHRALHCR